MNAVKSLFFTAATLVGIVGVMGSGADAQADAAPRHVRVVWTEDPAHSALISWTTDQAGASSRVLFDTVARGGEPEAYQAIVEEDAGSAYVAGGPFFHHTRLTDLQPSTAYHFVVQTDGASSQELYFVTAPASGTGFKLLYGGDSRTSPENRQRMNRRISRLHDDDPSILALVHGGDYIEDEDDWSQWTRWLDDHELTIGSDGRVLPIIPTKGNHEGRGVVYNRVFGNPGGSADTNWFATAIGDLTLITLDTEVSMAGAQRDWLEGALQRGRDAKWLVASYHRPAYPAVKSASGAREHWVPLFERYDVDLVCESDGHSLKRTVPIREDRVDYTGVTYVGEGGLGVPQRTPDPDRWYLQEPGMVTSAHHVQVLSFEPELLRYRVVLHEGTVLDELTIATHEARHAGRIAPTMAEAVTKDRVEVTFTEALAAESAADPAAWTIEPPLEVTKVEVSGASGNIATLHVSDLDPETVYRLSVTGVTDEASTAVVPGATVSFVHGGVDLRASAINTDAGLDHGESGGCSTTSGGSQTSLALAIWLFALGLWRARVVRVW